MREPRCIRVAVMSRFFPCCRDPSHRYATASYAAYDMEGGGSHARDVFVHRCPHIDYKRAKERNTTNRSIPNGESPQIKMTPKRKLLAM